MNLVPVVKSILFTLFIVATIGIVIPYFLLLIDKNRVDLGFFKYIGVLVIILGIFFYSASVLSFINLGGTPQIFFMKKLEGIFGLEPNKLSSKGIYTFSRNPMYTGVFLFIFGLSILFESVYVFIEAVIFFIIVNFVVIYIEEPHLRQLHGTEYENYLKSTPRWIGFHKKK